MLANTVPKCLAPRISQDGKAKSGKLSAHLKSKVYTLQIESKKIIFNMNLKYLLKVNIFVRMLLVQKSNLRILINNSMEGCPFASDLRE